ncbi:MAG: hypothetical protein M0C28_15180 [Candidatus Moduliflexus flocculans]|nr:hypothetical protein [Candidatus Moduliflexus flocculans]
MRYIAAPWRADYVRRGVDREDAASSARPRKGRDDRGARPSSSAAAATSSCSTSTPTRRAT